MKRLSADSRAEDVLETMDDVRGETILITGTTSGIGMETARSLALHGAHVIMANRDDQRSMALRESILNEKSDAIVDLVHLDLSSLASVKSAVDEILHKNWRVNVLVLNAGVFAPSVESTVDGYESTWAVNHLAHFYLLLLLLPMLRSWSTKPSRVVFVSSTSHRHSAINGRSTTEEKLRQLIPSIREERRTNGLSSSYRLYARSKLCNILTAQKLHRIEQEAEKNETTSGIRVYSLHPGSMMATDISRSYGFLGRAFMYLMKPFTKDLKQGAATTVYCAVHPDVDQESGRYFEGCCGDEKNLSIDLAHDEALQDALWQYSVDLLRSANLIDDTTGR